ncbi:adenine nucleotide translocase lysine N-methyltransferase isoform X7 [Marmota monax]|uniref:adenine nucleotide translocase lysine N-methyltransferase isoform X7 n=1 Tax=Marmota monax TaxID=9995 RepID=UPI0026EDD8E3|nr:adenine nucleotide translocase lysine N-methyltransferase isoform X7 [Marmota monax]
MPPPALFCALCCGLLAVSARAGYSEDRCSWRGSGLTQEPGSVGQLTLACVEGAIEWLYPAGALRLTLGAPDFGTRPGITCLRPARPFAGAQVFAEREGGSLELLLTEGPGLAGGRCVHWGPRERRALFLQATPHRDISRRVAAFRFELREDRSPELPPQVHGLGEDDGNPRARAHNNLLPLWQGCCSLGPRRPLWEVTEGSRMLVPAGPAVMRSSSWLHAPVTLVPYVGASARQVEHVLSLLRGRPGKMVDLGSGDGRIVLAAHRCGLRPAVGYELNPWLVGLARLHAWRAGCAGSVCYLREDLWKVSLRDCRNVSVFLAPSVLPLLEDKLLAELPAGARVVSGRFPLPTWQPVAVIGEGLDRVWAYDVDMDVHHARPAATSCPILPTPGPGSALAPSLPSSQAG